ncbi:helix-turn-helix domain-containing protein [Paenibacillus aquistagni]|uniref:helix-turn-helix domain-containing protein n=1 Tax=Paenibacillus aquistagni TaxID=1852522 RepID=UPI00145B6B01|nr:helix-turn-helix domain-containing protein [Paenibacillus aquistagni]NMM52933.1 helix-turn-helix domain-containing protein [Paenibacillus aquistagni]
MKNEFDFSKISLRQNYQMLRKLKKIKLKDLASVVGVSIPMLSMYENEVVNLHKDKEKMYRSFIISFSKEKSDTSAPCKVVNSIE